MLSLLSSFSIHHTQNCCHNRYHMDLIYVPDHTSNFNFKLGKEYSNTSYQLIFIVLFSMFCIHSLANSYNFLPSFFLALNGVNGNSQYGIIESSFDFISSSVGACMFIFNKNPPYSP